MVPAKIRLHVSCSAILDCSKGQQCISTHEVQTLLRCIGCWQRTNGSFVENITFCARQTLIVPDHVRDSIVSHASGAESTCRHCYGEQLSITGMLATCNLS